MGKRSATLCLALCLALCALLDAAALAAPARAEYEGGTKLYHVLPKYGEPLEPVLAPLEDPENYLVAFLYKPAGGTATCTEPVPLADFLN